MRVLVVLVPILLLVGCLGAKDAPAATAPAKVDLGPKPTMAKFSFDATGAPASPLDPVTMPKPATHDLAVPAATGKLHLAIDVGAPTAPGDITVTLADAAGKALYTSAALTGAKKLVADVDAPAEGAYLVKAQAHGAWKVGVVATFFPVGFQPGHVVMVSFPEQTKVDHSFQPMSVEVKAGEPVRITLYDYDPHAGIDNLQHNLRFTTFDAPKTEGKTTWGEVRVLDFTAPSKPGDYPFECEFHHFTGTLVVK